MFRFQMHWTLEASLVFSSAIISGIPTPSLTTEAGDYDPVLNQFTPRANAVGLSKFFMRVADLNNNCREVFYIEISGGVLAGPTPPPSGPSVGGPIIKADFKQAYSVNIYPNPTSEGFTVTSSVPLSHKTTLSLYDLQGRLIERKDFKAEGQTSIYFKLSPSYSTRIISA